MVCGRGCGVDYVDHVGISVGYSIGFGPGQKRDKREHMQRIIVTIISVVRYEES